MTHEKFFGRCFLCLLHEKEVAPFLKEIKTKDVEIALDPSLGSLQITFSSQTPVDSFIEKVAKRFPDYFLGEKPIAEALQIEMKNRKKTLGVAESCTGGAIGAKLTSVPGASSFFSGSIVAYSNDWKERFLGLKRDALLKSGAVSSATVKEMAEALFAETNVDYAIAVSGFAGPSSGDEHEKEQVGTVYIAVAKRGEKTDVGKISSSLDRLGSIELTV